MSAYMQLLCTYKTFSDLFVCFITHLLPLFPALLRKSMQSSSCLNSEIQIHQSNKIAMSWEKLKQQVNALTKRLCSVQQENVQNKKNESDKHKINNSINVFLFSSSLLDLVLIWLFYRTNFICYAAAAVTSWSLWWWCFSLTVFTRIFVFSLSLSLAYFVLFLLIWFSIRSTIWPNIQWEN